MDNNVEDVKKKIGLRIKQLRLESKLTQEELASKLTTVKGKSSIANYENGSNLPSDEAKLELCHIFNCSLDYLMCKTDIRNIEQLKKIEFANNEGLDTTGLDKDDILELQRTIDYIKKMKNKKEK